MTDRPEEPDCGYSLAHLTDDPVFQVKLLEDLAQRAAEIAGPPEEAFFWNSPGEEPGA